MDRFLGFVKQIRRSRRRKGKKYRPEEDYHEGYEDVYYYASEHLHQRKLLERLQLAAVEVPCQCECVYKRMEWTFMAILVYIAELLLFECYLVCLDSTLPFNRSCLRVSLYTECRFPVMRCLEAAWVMTGKRGAGSPVILIPQLSW
ncbi:hypothetical protein DPX16_12942 [Anabarilius grahami]|uniref:Uncharacterized protein n=1 Tax=Anabarilius grahami TaxID=495550 RepID=A0A3N0XDI7_ANAGA|nr:hypothetical protein DPX16_12942 [Anabarilius grahami]